MNTVNTVIRLGESDDRTAKQKAFRKQFADNLNAALDRRGAIPSGYGRVIGVAELFGVSQNTAAIWLKGEGVPELSRMPEIAEILCTTVEQLVTGNQSDMATHLIDENYVMVDMHEDDSLGGYSWYTLPETLRSMGLPHDIKMLKVNNDDMAPFVWHGDVVVYDSRVKRIQTNGVFVLQMDDVFMVRRVQRGLNQSIRLICDNPAFGDEILDQGTSAQLAEGNGRVTVVGHVVGRLLMGA